jgi:Fe-S-cluster containining protein
MTKWRCIKNCGACCHLEPAERPDLELYLTPSEFELYLRMVGENGWCINFDGQTRECRIYEQRPRFCRVRADIFQQMYSISPDEFDDFAISCCYQQIEGVYGKLSPEFKAYQQEVI